MEDHGVGASTLTLREVADQGSDLDTVPPGPALDLHALFHFPWGPSGSSLPSPPAQEHPDRTSFLYGLYLQLRT